MAKKRETDCPLKLHRNGQWYRKVKGRFYYFGKDKDAALEAWAEGRDYYLAGRTPPLRDGSPSLAELGNLYLARCRQRVQSGELVQRSVDAYEATIARMIEFRGRDDRPAHWTPQVFAEIKEAFHQPVKRKAGPRGGLKGKAVDRRSPVSVAGDIRRARAFLSWASDSELLEHPPRYGKEFSPASQKAIRRQRAKEGRRDIPAADLRKIIESASLHFKPLVLLGVNAGIGNQDLADIRLDQLPELCGDVWVDLPRGKTGAPRRFLLWPETRDAIDAYLEKRPGPAGASATGVLFLTKQGHPWIRGDGGKRTDAIGHAFLKTRRQADVARGTFYDLRRTFATVAGETQDFPAARFIMGHAVAATDMAGLYTQAISDARLRAVTDHVRAWLFGEGE